MKLHPDKNKAPGADEAFKRISAAFSTLSDETKRSDYDNRPVLIVGYLVIYSNKIVIMFSTIQVLVLTEQILILWIQKKSSACSLEEVDLVLEVVSIKLQMVHFTERSLQGSHFMIIIFSIINNSMKLLGSKDYFQFSLLLYI